MKYELVVQKKKGHNFSYHIPKKTKLKRKLTFDIPIWNFQIDFLYSTLEFQKFKFQNGLKQKTSNSWAFLRQTGLWEPNLPKKVQVIFADSEPCERCGDFGTQVDR